MSTRPWKVRLGVLALIGSVPTALAAADASTPGPRAARSVHLGWPAPAGDLFYLEMVVEQSTPGSYFMACGWDTGYFGIQELSGPGERVALFSVWDPSRGDDPDRVPVDQRVEVLHQDPSVRVKRFGGEGTGGQCFLDFAWQVGATNRFLVRAVVEGDRTSYSGYLFGPADREWRHLVTFRTRTGGRWLGGYYSFVEDFRRDYASARVVRQARFGHGWIRKSNGDWVPLTRARFTASGAEWEAKETIDAAVSDGVFRLATGGATRNTQPLNSFLETPAPTPPSPTTARPDDLEKLLRQFARDHPAPVTGQKRQE